MDKHEDLGPVLVVGAGVAGLQTARALIKQGFEVLILEQTNDTGGLWAKDFLGKAKTGVQVPYKYYQFPEYPWPQYVEKTEYPGGESVYAYIRSYAEHFNLLPRIRFNCQLARMQQTQPSGWHVIYLDHSSGFFEELTVGYVVMCTGICALPNLPQYPGSSLFKGLQLHTKQVTDVQVTLGKHVVVVGAGKSALDWASEVAISQQAATITWVLRQAHWPIPRKLAFNLPMERLIFSRLPNLVLPPYYRSSKLRAACQRLLRPGQRMFWELLERHIQNEFRMEGCLLPGSTLDQDLFNGGQIVESTWIRLIERVGPDSASTTSSTTSSCFGRYRAASLLAGSSSSVSGSDGSDPPGPTCIISRGGSSNSNSLAVEAQQEGAKLGAMGQQPKSSGLKPGWWAGRLRGKGPGSAGIPAAAGPAAKQQQGQGQEQPPEAGFQARQVASIRPVHGELAEFTESGVLLTSGQYLPADVVLYCTGYTKSYDYLKGSVKARLGLQKDGLYLYRNILSPRVPGLAFIGSEVSTFNNVLTGGLQAEWLARVLLGRLQLPSQEDMLLDVRSLQQWRRSVMPAQRNRGSVYQLYMHQYHAQLMRDMGYKPKRGSLMSTLSADDYAHVFKSSAGTGAAFGDSKHSINGSSFRAGRLPSAVGLAPISVTEGTLSELQRLPGPKAVAHAAAAALGLDLGAATDTDTSSVSTVAATRHAGTVHAEGSVGAVAGTPWQNSRRSSNQQEQGAPGSSTSVVDSPAAALGAALGTNAGAGGGKVVGVIVGPQCPVAPSAFAAAAAGPAAGGAGAEPEGRAPVTPRQGSVTSTGSGAGGRGFLLSGLLKKGTAGGLARTRSGNSSTAGHSVTRTASGGSGGLSQAADSEGTERGSSVMKQGSSVCQQGLIKVPSGAHGLLHQGSRKLPRLLSMVRGATEGSSASFGSSSRMQRAGSCAAGSVSKGGKQGREGERGSGSGVGTEGSGSGLRPGTSWPSRGAAVPLGGDHGSQDPLAPVRQLVMQLQERAEYESEQEKFKQGALATAACLGQSADGGSMGSRLSFDSSCYGGAEGALNGALAPRRSLSNHKSSEARTPREGGVPLTSVIETLGTAALAGAAEQAMLHRHQSCYLSSFTQRGSLGAVPGRPSDYISEWIDGSEDRGSKTATEPRGLPLSNGCPATSRKVAGGSSTWGHRPMQQQQDHRAAAGSGSTSSQGARAPSINTKGSTGRQAYSKRADVSQAQAGAPLQSPQEHQCSYLHQNSSLGSGSAVACMVGGGGGQGRAEATSRGLPGAASQGRQVTFADSAGVELRQQGQRMCEAGRCELRQLQQDRRPSQRLSDEVRQQGQRISGAGRRELRHLQQDGRPSQRMSDEVRQQRSQQMQAGHPDHAMQRYQLHRRRRAMQDWDREQLIQELKREQQELNMHLNGKLPADLGAAAPGSGLSR